MKKLNIVAASVSVVSFAVGLILPVAVFASGPATVNLLSANNFVILAKSGISTTGTTSVVGDIGVSPAAATFITGFSLSLPVNSAYATSSLVTGKVYAPGYADPTSSNISVAVSDMQTAYTDATGRTNPTATELGAGNIGGMTLAPGLYKWGTGVTIPSDITLSGSANDVWIFQIAQNLNVSSGVKVTLAGGAQSSNIFWVVSGQTTLGTASVFNGNILDQTAIVLNTGATLNGRALAQTAVTLDANSVVIPTYSISTPTSVTTNSAYSNGSGSSVVVSSTNYIAPVTTNKEGCNNQSGFSITTGQSCSSNTTTITTTTPVVIVGCKNGTLGFSIVNGQSCALNTGNVVTTTSYNFGLTTLKNGSKGESVKELQRFLNKVLKMNLKEDGVLGKNTIFLVKKWQKDNGLVADGFIGAKTKLRMNSQH